MLSAEAGDVAIIEGAGAAEVTVVEGAEALGAAAAAAGLEAEEGAALLFVP